MRRVLFICTAFPPVIGGGSVRNVRIARGLADRGYVVSMVTGARRAPGWEDATPLADLGAGVHVERVTAPDLVALGRRVGGADVPTGARQRGPGLRGALRRTVLTWLLVPDADAPWIPFAVARVRSLLARERYDALLTAGPPHSSHLVGRLAGGGSRIRWVIDSQDPWADHPFPLTDSRVRHRIDRWLEGLAFRRADAIVSATASQTRRFREVHRDRADRFVTLPSGYDEREFADLVPARVLGRAIVHLGSFYGARSPRGLLAALRSMPSRAVAGSRVILAGYADPPNARLIHDAMADPAIGALVTYEPVIPRRQGLELMLGAHALLLVTDPLGGGRDLIPIKTFEYLRAGRPILALVPEGETAALLRRTGGALVAHPEDVPAIAAALERVLAAPPPPPDPAVVAELEVGHTIDGLAALLDGAASSRIGSPS